MLWIAAYNCLYVLAILYALVNNPALLIDIRSMILLLAPLVLMVSWLVFDLKRPSSGRLGWILEIGFRIFVFLAVLLVIHCCRIDA